jgi:Protein of unknwon function (DUF3310)
LNNASPGWKIAQAQTTSESIDNINHPKHYTSCPANCSKCSHPIECIDIVQHMGFSLGNAIKYIWRADLKNNAIEDLKKSVWYLQAEIARREKQLNDQLDQEDQCSRG